MRTTREKIKIMEAYENKEKIEFRLIDHEYLLFWLPAFAPNWDWELCDYRIKEEKKTVIIEK